MKGGCLILAFVAAATSLTAQTGAWQLTGGVSTVYLNPENGWGFGPSLRLERHPAGKVGFDGALRVLISSSGFYSANAVSADIGIAVPLMPGRAADVAMLGGGGVALGNDSDGTFIAEGGPYLGLRIGGPLTSSLGWGAAGAGRIWIRSGTVLAAANFDAGLAVRF